MIESRRAGQVRQTALSLAAEQIGGRVVILTGSTAGSRQIARFVADAGATPREIPLADLPTETRSRFAAMESALHHPTGEVVDRIDGADPTGSGLVYAGSFTAVSTLAGRKVIGARTPAVLAVERKDIQQSLLDLPGRIVPIDDFQPAGPAMVVQGIPADGVAMATSHTYLMPPHSEAHPRQDTVLATLRRDCRQLRIAPFHPGIPCTFYGFVTGSDVIDFGPVEALVFWDPQTWRLVAPGIVRPLPLQNADAVNARIQVHDVATRLRERAGYVGAFGVDGVLTTDGYVIHEINPRVCAGFSLLNRLAPDDAPLSAVDLTLRESPEAATQALTAPLSRLAAEVSRDQTPTYRLWDDPAPLGDDELRRMDRRQLAAFLTESAGVGRIALRTLQDHASWR
ncbi:hypothetical protein SAMN05660350_00420 [Geodermatophilus obscurus]|uniref:ATP-grasp domain-containing protein n=1 Tax=Geodermatophilus obscurus TaxID=1861 RepID=A0A1M7S2S3_9ACTN|nr:hypothetical protein [Geodermatophilus obscurus]SHN52726.1 hypothetical protein SAMN05660350_00420 [Geodermatophilus obscurus]